MTSESTFSKLKNENKSTRLFTHDWAILRRARARENRKKIPHRKRDENHKTIVVLINSSTVKPCKRDREKCGSANGKTWNTIRTFWFAITFPWCYCRQSRSLATNSNFRSHTFAQPTHIYDCQFVYILVVWHVDFGIFVVVVFLPLLIPKDSNSHIYFLCKKRRFLNFSRWLKIT